MKDWNDWMKEVDNYRKRKAQWEKEEHRTMLVVRNRETGIVLEQVFSEEEGMNLIREYEEVDREDGTYTMDFYDLAEVSVDDEYETIELLY